MKKKPTQKPKPTPEYDSQRQQNVLLERIEKKVGIIAEGHSGLDRKIDKTNERLDGMDDRLQIISNKMSEHGNKLIEHDRRFDRIEMVVTENRTDIKVLKAGQEELKTDVNRIETRLDTIEHKVDTVTTDHEHRIQNLEAVK